MTLPVFLAEGFDIPETGSGFVWRGPESDHARKVMRLRTSDRLELVDGDGLRATCVVLEVGERDLQLRVESKVAEGAAPVQVTLVQALAKAGRDEQAVEMCTELGVDRIVPWQAARSIVKWPATRAEKAHQKWVNTVRAASKQSRRADWPRVAHLATTADLVRVLRRAGDENGLTLVLHEEAAEPIGSAVSEWARDNSRGTITLVVGPEGGIDESELADLVSSGAIPVRVGPNVLRTSTAGASALSIVNVLAGRWR